MKNIYVGNLPYSVRDDELRKTFEAYGTVQTAEVIIDRRRNRSRGYGFVVMTDDQEAQAAIEALDGSDMHGRSLRVDESRPKGDEGDSRRDSQRTQAGAHKPESRRPGEAEKPPARTGIRGVLKKIFG